MGTSSGGSCIRHEFWHLLCCFRHFLICYADLAWEGSCGSSRPSKDAGNWEKNLRSLDTTSCLYMQGVQHTVCMQGESKLIAIDAAKCDDGIGLCFCLCVSVEF